MITCPYCGTNYSEWREKCKACGGPLPKLPPASQVNGFQVPGVQITLGEPLAPARFQRPDPPPPAPRPISSTYAFRFLFSGAWGIVGAIFTLVGFPFACVGISTLLAEPILGIVFGTLGLVFAVLGVFALVTSVNRAFKEVEALRHGDTAEGELTEVKEDYSTTINGNHPWIIKYRFNAAGSERTGEVRTMNYVGATHAPGMPAWVLYLRENPGYNSLYPHP